MTLSESFAQVPVDLDDVEVIDPREQGRGQRSEARPDLDDVVVAAGIDGLDDSLDHFGIDEKMLAEPFPRDVTARQHSG
jgi:hypothetical protein